MELSKNMQRGVRATMVVCGLTAIGFWFFVVWWVLYNAMPEHWMWPLAVYGIAQLGHKTLSEVCKQLGLLN